MERILSTVDWFIPKTMLYSNSERSLARNFVFTHLCGPLMSQMIVIFLHVTDPQGGWRVWTITGGVFAFLLLPFLLRARVDIMICAFLSVQLLAFVSLFGAFHYGGATSPFLPWLIVSLLLAFFYLSRHALLVVGLFAGNFLAFFAAYFVFGFEDRVPPESLEIVGWFSILSAAVYVGWMAIYYTNMLSMRNELLRQTKELVAMNERLQEAKGEADRANQQRSIFLAKMSHELRTPLNAVIGYSEIISEAAEGDEQKLRDINRITASGKHLLALVTEVLDIARIERNEITIDVADFDLTDMANLLIASTENLIKANGNRLVLDIATKMSPVRTDVTKLRQVALNLISNAAKFTHNGTISLIVRRDRALGGDWIEIHVQDTGIGIGPAELPRLFTNFGQASASTSSRFGGTGIGLVHSQRLCGLLGGRITVSSDRGKGSLFTIRVPAKLGTLEERAAESASTPLAFKVA